MTRTEKVLIHGPTWAVTGTGLVYGWMKYFMHNDDPFSVVNHPWQPMALSWHVMAAPLLVFAMGLIAQDHILARIKDEPPVPSRRTGLMGALLVVPMILSGYGLQVASEVLTRKILVGVHVGTSAVFMLVYVVHVFLSRRALKATKAAAEPGAKQKPSSQAVPGVARTLERG